MPNWGNYIFQSANEMTARMHFQKRLDEIESKTEAEKQWWEKRKSTIQTDFMNELDAEQALNKTAATKASSDEDSVLVETPSITDKGSTRKRKGKK